MFPIKIHCKKLNLIFHGFENIAEKASSELSFRKHISDHIFSRVYFL